MSPRLMIGWKSRRMTSSWWWHVSRSTSEKWTRWTRSPGSKASTPKSRSHPSGRRSSAASTSAIFRVEK